MNELIAIIEKNKKAILVICAALMFVLFAFCPVCNILGKDKINGLKMVFDADGIGFARVVGFFMLLVPVIIIISEFVELKMPENLKSKLGLYCFLAALLLFILFAILLPKGIYVAIGAYLYMIFGVIGILATYLPTRHK